MGGHLVLDRGLVARTALGCLRAEPGRIRRQQIPVNDSGEKRRILADRSVHPCRGAPDEGQPVRGFDLENGSGSQSLVAPKIGKTTVGEAGTQRGRPQREIVRNEGRSVPFRLGLMEKSRTENRRCVRAVIAGIAVHMALVTDAGRELVTVELLHPIRQVSCPGSERRLDEPDLGLPVAARGRRQREPRIGDTGVGATALGKPQQGAGRRQEAELALQRGKRRDQGILPPVGPGVIETAFEVIEAGTPIPKHIAPAALQQPAKLRETSAGCFGA